MSYCFKGRKNAESKNPKVARIKKGRIIILSKCAVWGSMKSQLINEQEAIGLLSSLGVQTYLNKLLTS